MVAGVAASVGRDDGSAYMAFLDREIGLGNLLQCLERAWFDCFRASAVRAAATATEHGAGGWLYDFEVETDHELGVTHFADVPFTFNWVRDGHPREFVHPSTPENEEIAEMWSATVVEFVKHGDPNGHGLPEWPTYGPDDRSSLRVRRQSEVVQDVDADLLEIYRAI